MTRTIGFASIDNKWKLVSPAERNFTFPSPQIALMTGRVEAKARSAGKPIQSVLGVLAVWREEKGKWRLLAWQGCFVTPPAAPAK